MLEGAKIVDRTGAVGKIRSVYVRDPDGNLVEYVDVPFSSQTIQLTLVIGFPTMLECSQVTLFI